jgi:predicted nucleic acid-binding protein
MLQLNQKLRQMAGMRVYIDTNILIYFFNKDPRYFYLVSSFLQQCADRKILGTASQLVVAEVLVLPYRDKNFEAVAQIKAFFGQKDFLHVS